MRRLVRSSPDKQNGDIRWDPATGVLDARALEGSDAIVHLAGAPIAQRWTVEHKRELLDSRVDSTSLLARTIAGMSVKPSVVLSGSAIGYYGDRGDEALDEASTSGTDFLAGVARAWEGAAAPIAEAGVRLVPVRTGIVLSPKGGALAKLLPPFRLGAGGPMGGGRQWMSWISLDDQLHAMEHALFTPAVHGPANFVAPNPVTNADFATTLGNVLHRPALIPVPGFALSLLFGEMAEATILAGQRVRPAVLAGSGFLFSEPTLDGALRRLLNATP